MQAFIHFISIVLPAAAVLFGMYLTIKTFLQKDYEKRRLELKLKNNELVLPIRLQAYERMCLFLERIALSNLIVRVNESGMTSAAFHGQLLSAIREEYNHNLSQQVYMSDNAWKIIKSAMQEVTTIINTASDKVDPQSRSIELAKMIFEVQMMHKQDAVETALKYVKEEIQKVF